MSPQTQQSPTPQQALQLLDEAVSQLTANRAVHSQLVTCVNVINAALAELTAKVSTDAKPTP